ncbi:DUF1501 domain-containing protein [Aphanothece sacrum]|uniref:Twin-arginine translocation pathway signal n=1 Tax=Aphanothece sacrum FPU1 TaxID=1920663 RepID=A0A401IL56_APHSA|nr:DUF1501 domain-containing protein [Aphanothece sacrum]GBF81971.1 hypothetical protein AsFPU1_3394 [Aphanothece sacrum FPU1]GBF83600.1 hypothetical protein AsFPU3_0643 [Aphanothece sacrum FPU3]
MDRRTFLKQAGLISSSSLISIGLHGWAAPVESANPKPKRLIVIFLRGGVDGLNVVVPYQEAEYYQARPKIAIPHPGKTDGVINLDGRFGLHPALSSLSPFWKNKSLAFVHACGSSNETRSHFDAQDFMESGTPGIKGTSDGWMNRLLANLPGKNPVQAVNVGTTTPRILSGKIAVASMPPNKPGSRRTPIDRPEISQAFNGLYSGNDDLGRTYREGMVARQTLNSDVEKEMKMANNGAPLPNGFVKDAQRLAQLMAKNSNIQLAFLPLGGWDTHVNQGNSKGQLANRLKALGEGLATLANGLGSVYQDTTIIVLSEFGRTFRENGNGGTDHGHGNVLWLLGGDIKGGKVYGKWTGLAKSQLYQGRDLAVTTDFRDGITPILSGHLQLNPTQIRQVFPNYKIQQNIPLI